MGGKFHLKLNIGTRPIANKYCEGKMKSTLKRELKAREIVKREPIEGSSAFGVISRASGESGAMTAQACRPRGQRCARCTYAEGGSTSVCRVGDGVREGNRSRAVLQPEPFAAWETEAAQRGPLGWPSARCVAGRCGTACSVVAGGGACLCAAQPRSGC